MKLNYLKKLEIPQDSYLGINYSSTHDTSVAIVSPDYQVLFSCSLERVSRIKMDGRFPHQIINELPLDKFSGIYLPYYHHHKDAIQPLNHNEIPLTFRNSPLKQLDSFPEKVHQYYQSLGLPIHYVGHHISHAALAYHLSGFAESHILTYDGGAYESPWFGGIFSANHKKILFHHGFPSITHAKITTLYSIITALLGFRPVKHEGKITGLAAKGSANLACYEKMLEWFEHRYDEMEAYVEWVHMFDENRCPYLWVKNKHMLPMIEDFKQFSKEDIAFCLQQIAEEHTLKIVKKINRNQQDGNLCLAGGLFANVKLNQKIKELGFRKVFIAPPMGDDGLALGAILAAHHGQIPSGIYEGATQMFLGPEYTSSEVNHILSEHGVIPKKVDHLPTEIAKQLAQNKTVAIFQGKMELGPRALCHRSILASPHDAKINDTLNKKLQRTEFMPFAPVLLKKNLERCFEEVDAAIPALPFMTITLKAKEEFAQKAPAVVHVDQTARPQYIEESQNAFMATVLEKFEEITQIPALINTSFNVHEEPIVCTPEDALRGFTKSKLDYLVLEDQLISFAENEKKLLEMLKAESAMEHPCLGEDFLKPIIEQQILELKEKEAELKNLSNELNLRNQHLEEKEKEIKQFHTASEKQQKTIEEMNQAMQKFENHWLTKIYRKFFR